MYTDIHSHIIPEVDDGACSKEEALGLLQSMVAEGITSVIATPHFYADLSPRTPREHRIFIEERLNKLKSALPNGSPTIYLGHEVHYFKGLSACEEITELCIQKSKYFLLELPYSKFSSSVPQDIAEFSLNFGVKPILAHVERYCRQPEFNAILSLIKEGFCKGQLNCDSVIDKHFRRVSLDLIKSGYISYLATDAHNTYERPPRYCEAKSIIEKKLGKAISEKLVYNANLLIEEIED